MRTTISIKAETQSLNFNLNHIKQVLLERTDLLLSELLRSGKDFQLKFTVGRNK